MSTVITPFQGTDPFSTATFNNRISQINTGFSYISNPNLLDNWYFSNPVNQRGKSSYTGAGYGIDRWYLGAGTLLIKDGYVQVIGGSFSERFEASKIIDGQIYTASWLTYEGKLHTASGVLSKDSTGWQIDHWDGNIFIGVTKYSSDTFRSEISDSAGNPINLKAAKLELGSQQTLAHQENGNWVLNEIPDYGEQLARCQRYHVKGRLSRVPTLIYGSGKELWFSIKLPVPMRAAIPALVKITTYAWIYHQGTAYDANGAQEFLPGESTNFITTDTDCTHSGEIGVHLTLDNALTNAVDGSTGWIAYIDYELTENL